jgi:hypothetical protein
MRERTPLAFKLIGSHIILIIVLIIFSILPTNYPFFALGIVQTLLAILYFAGYWEFFGLRFKKVFCGLSELIILFVFFWKFSSGSGGELNVFIVFILSMIQLYLLIELVLIIRVINERKKSAIEIEFPFKQGNYLVTDGGNSRMSRLMNYHYYSAIHKRNKTSNSMLYATDIVKISGSKSGFLPHANENYHIFNDTIYSPISGIVVRVINGIPDNQPFSGNYPYNTGNTVVIRKDNLYCLLGHLKKDSIVVKEGDVVKSKDLIGSAGNSGWTERPHLHMQLIQSNSDNYWSGQGVGICYRKKVLYKNRVVVM